MTSSPDAIAFWMAVAAAENDTEPGEKFGFALEFEAIFQRSVVILVIPRSSAPRSADPRIPPMILVPCPPLLEASEIS